MQRLRKKTSVLMAAFTVALGLLLAPPESGWHEMKAQARNQVKVPSPSRPHSNPAELQRAPTNGSQPLVLPRGTVLQLRLVDAINSRKNRSGDSFEATLSEPVLDGDNTLLQAGSRFEGTLLSVESSGRVKGRAEIVLVLERLFLEGESYPLETSSLTFQAQSGKSSDTKKVALGAGIGAVLGAVLGGKGGAGTGAAIGSGTAAAGVLLSKGKAVKLRAEQPISFRLEEDLVLERPVNR